MLCPDCGCLVEENDREIKFSETEDAYEETVMWVDMECPCCGWTDNRIED